VPKTCDEFTDSTNNVTVRFDINAKFGNNNLREWIPTQLELKQGEKVLDIGCGSGTYLRDIAKIVNEENSCFGIDYDKEMINKSIELSKDIFPPIKFIIMNMDDIGKADHFGDNFFDLVYSVYAFYYSKNEFTTLENIKRILKPDGRISIIGPHSENNKNWWNFLEQFMKVPDSLKHANTEFMKDIENYARKNFKKVTTSKFVNDINLPTIDVLMQYWKSNIYYEPKYDSEFEKHAKIHFDKFGNFQYSKKAQLITMKTPY